MFRRLNSSFRRPLAKAARRKARRRPSGRSLRHEGLESRQVLTLLGVAPLEVPLIDFDSGGTTSYDSTTDRFSVSATPVNADLDAGIPGQDGLFFSGSVDINIDVDDTGALIGGAPGDDFVLIGDLDSDFDFITDIFAADGPILTGEIVAFGFEDSGGSTDLFDFQFEITGGQLAGLYEGTLFGVTLTSESSTFTGDFSVDFGGAAKGEVGDIEDPAGNPGIDIEKLTNGFDADLPGQATTVNAGDTITTTYIVTNTGDVDFDFADVVVSDDNGTPGDASDDISTTSGEITFIAASDDGGDGILSAGETWQYQSFSTALDLTSPGAPVVVDFEGFPAGTVIDDELSGLGLTVTSNDPVNHPPMIFDTANPTGGDTDLANATLGNVLIISEDADSSDPDDNAAGGTLSFIWDEPVSVDSVTLLDIDLDEGGGNLAFFFDDQGGLLGSVPIPALGDGSVQTIDVGFDGVARMDVNLVSSGAVAEVVFRRPEAGIFKNVATVTAPGATDSDCSHYRNGNTPDIDQLKLNFNSGGTTTYDADSDLFSIDATPVSVANPNNNVFGLFFSGDLDLDFIVDENGDFVSGVAGDDFVLVGDLDFDGDFIVDFSGVLLTGEVISFEATDSGGDTDTYETRVAITGGIFSSLYEGSDLLINTTSENSTFTGDFTGDFGGSAKGEICAVDTVSDVMASIGNYVFIDRDNNGLQNAGDQGINGIAVNLLNSDGIVIASTVTDFDGSGNAGFYLFKNLEAGDYTVEFETPEGVVFTAKDAGDDTRDSDVNVDTGLTDVITVADGEHRRDIDAGILDKVQKEGKVYEVWDYVNYHQNKRAGKIKGVDLVYDEHADELYVSVDFKQYYGRLTDGFTIVVTPGEWPAGTEDKYAIFYFDADIHHRHGGPVLSVYGYNGRYNAQSFRDSDGDLSTDDADRIASSLDDDSFVRELDVHTYRSHGRWHRTMTFRIDASIVNDHLPLQGGEWGGAQFADRVSFALDTYDGLYTKYNHDGYLKKWWACRHGWMDGCWVHTTCETVVTCEPIDDFIDDFGWVVTDYVEGISDGDPPVDADDDDSDFDWAGSVDVAVGELFA